MASADGAYLDTSALVKLVVREAQTDGLVAFLGDHPHRFASALARTELVRAARRVELDLETTARTVLDGLELLAVSDAILDRAGGLVPSSMRSLDAIHLASALEVGDHLRVVVTYDARMRDAAGRLGLATAAPT